MILKEKHHHGHDVGELLYIHRHTFIHELAPETKILSVFLFILVVVATPIQNFLAYCFYALLVLSLSRLAQIPFRTLYFRSLIEIPFVFFALLMPFFGSGERIEWFGLQLYREGIWAGAAIVAKGTIGVMMGILLSTTTTAREILEGLERLRIPSPILGIASFMIRYVNVVNDTAMERLMGYVNSGKIRLGGTVNKSMRKIAPTILEHVSWEDAVMQQEIFGPILPIIEFDNLNEVIEKLQVLDKPLAMYYFGSEREAVRLRNATSSGAFCHNDVLLHVANHDLPFGGVGNSGMGKYHGKASFLAFSHEKAVLKSSSWLDFRIKYPPYHYMGLIKRLL